MYRQQSVRLIVNDGFLEAEILEPPQSADACVIWLHGLGANGDDFVPVVPHLKLPEALQVRFIFPHAPAIPVTCNGGYIMPAWYDILALTEIREINSEHLQQSQQRINDIIRQQMNQGIAAERIVIIGFSQGGAVAYHAALTYPALLAGLIALSTYLPEPGLIENTDRSANQSIPVRIAHGDFDDMVTERAARLARDWCVQQGYDVEWKTYRMGHEVCVSEIRQIGSWIVEMLGAN